MARYHIGIYVGKKTHHVCIRNLYRDTYSKAFSISCDLEGFLEFVSTLEKFPNNKDDFLIGVEACGPYSATLTYFLLSQGYKLVEINPFRAAQFRKAQGKKAKTDRIDANSLAAILSLDNHKPLSTPDPVLDNLRELTRFRVDLVKDKSSLLNQLHEALTILFPEFNKVFRQLDSRASLALLVAFPGPEHIIRAGEENIAQSLSNASSHRMGKGMAGRILKAARNTVGVLQKQPAMGIKLSILGERILALQGAINRLEEEIACLFHKLPYEVKDFPVGDITSLATLISEIGDIRRFATLKQFLSHFGWCPQTFQTCNYRLEHPRMSHAGNKYVRRLIWILSVGSIRVVPRYRAYFERRVKEGKAKMHILIAIGRKIPSTFYAILKRNITYDPNWEENRRLALAKH